MTPEEEKFDFFQKHFKDYRKDYAQYRKKLTHLIDNQEESVHILRFANSSLPSSRSDKIERLLDEKSRDILIIRSRLKKISKKLLQLSEQIRKASKSLDPILLEKSIDLFLDWRDELYEISGSSYNAISKWVDHDLYIINHLQ